MTGGRHGHDRAPAAPRRVEIGGARVVYRVVGGGPPVVLVHGLGGSSRWWGRNVDHLARRFRVFLVDLPGFGGNRLGGHVVLAEMPALLAAWLDHLALGRIALVGHSMGGRVVAELAADAPDRVGRLVLVDAAIFPAGPGLPRQARGLAGAIRHVSPAFLPVLVTDAARVNPRTFLHASHALLTTGVEAKLTRIAAPTLVVWGEHDAIVPLAAGHRIAELVPAARLAVIADADHSPMWHQPDAFNALVLDFLTDSGSGGDGPP